MVDGGDWKSSFDAVKPSEDLWRERGLLSTLEELDMRLQDLKRCWNDMLRGGLIRTTPRQSALYAQYLLYLEVSLGTMNVCLEEMQNNEIAFRSQMTREDKG